MSFTMSDSMGKDPRRERRAALQERGRNPSAGPARPVHPRGPHGEVMSTVPTKSELIEASKKRRRSKEEETRERRRNAAASDDAKRRRTTSSNQENQVVSNQQGSTADGRQNNGDRSVDRRSAEHVGSEASHNSRTMAAPPVPGSALSGLHLTGREVQKPSSLRDHGFSVLAPSSLGWSEHDASQMPPQAPEFPATNVAARLAKGSPRTGHAQRVGNAEKWYPGQIFWAPHHATAYDRRADPKRDKNFVQTNVAIVSSKRRMFVHWFAIPGIGMQCFPVFTGGGRGIRGQPVDKQQHLVPLITRSANSIPASTDSHRSVNAQVFKIHKLSPNAFIDVSSSCSTAFFEETQVVGCISREDTSYIISAHKSLMDVAEADGQHRADEAREANARRRAEEARKADAQRQAKHAQSNGRQRR
ncbi:hypothetical protein TI39_contig4106g00003 [Zymoseptoria brevis]|uniref:Uncharacterized protein n=1 Tax=Zymoseptoria brevis TaxID=1047168 RepID=A0A0F4GDR8_9PEZI|nr:hypothetical protein TI39_contig4106g00003 [Zymoseptoria brevis]